MDVVGDVHRGAAGGEVARGAEIDDLTRGGYGRGLVAVLGQQPLRLVIEKTMFSSTEDLLPVISFNPRASEEDQQKHEDFVERLMEYGYTKKQVRLLSEWYLRVRKSQ